MGAVSEQTIGSLVKDVVAGNYKRFIKLGLVAVTTAFGGAIAGGAVHGLLDRVWADAKDAEAKQQGLTDEESQQRLEDVIRDSLRREMSAILLAVEEVAEGVEEVAEGQEGLRSDHDELRVLVKLAVGGDSAILRRLDTVRDRIDELTLADTRDTGRRTARDEVVLSALDRELRVPYWATTSELHFTIHNFTEHHLKLRSIELVIAAREWCDEVLLPRAGQVSENYELNVDLRGHGAGSFELLEGVGAQFTFSPDEAEGFSLSIVCDDGYTYRFELSADLCELTAPDHRYRSEPIEVTLVAPVTRPETLRERQGR